MKVGGFTFVRNALKFDYPIVESILSILPLCDEVVVAVGDSEDNTLNLVQSINSSKIRVIETVWDDHLREGGRVLAVETDKALAAISPDSDWAFYIQGDEVVHEDDVDVIRDAMYKYKNDLSVEGLLFNYKHFYGSYDYLGEASSWYRREIRIIRNKKNIYSYRDAQGFRKDHGKKLQVKLINASIYHYGWVRDPRAMQQKQETFQKYWHSDEKLEKMLVKADEFDYSGIGALCIFTGSHPAVMRTRIQNKNWKFDHDVSRKSFSFKDRIRIMVEKGVGYRVWEYKNYRIV